MLFNSTEAIVEQTLKRSFSLCMEIYHGATSMIMSFFAIYIQLFICLTSWNWSLIIDTVYFDCMLILYYQRTNISIHDHTSRVGISIIIPILQCMITKLMRLAMRCI